MLSTAIIREAMAFYQLTLRIPNASKDHFISILTEKGALGFIEDESGLQAFFPDTFDHDALIKELGLLKAVLDNTGIEPPFQFSSTSIPDHDWNESWKKGFTPIHVGRRFTILPPWEKPHPDRINLIIDPGMAFGTGHHETTRSCLVLMEKYDSPAVRDRFLDVGTGTGLLAIAAAKLGFRQVVALDTDPLAVEAARLNTGLNSTFNVDIHEGSITDMQGVFDCIVANIISGVLIRLAPHLAARLRTSGIAILSGILAGQEDEVIVEMQKSSLRLRDRYKDDKWVSLVFGY
jgi:ribosomal protein L11 methyltransferase